VPIEIKELHIRVAVTAPETPAPASASTVQDTDRLVALCVERVMQVLADRAER